jgi:hypothetical protein
MRSVLFALATAVALSGCAGLEQSMQASDAQEVETQLRFANFRLIPSDTPQRIESMRSLPPLAFSRVLRRGQPYFVYADPVSCMCLWVGTRADYDRFLQLSAEAQMNTQQEIAQDIEMQADLWDPEWGSIDGPMDPVMDPDL